MAQCGNRARFLLESSLAVRIGCHRVRKRLDSDVAVQSRVARAIDFTRSAGAEPLQDLVRSESRSRFECHGLE